MISFFLNYKIRSGIAEHSKLGQRQTNLEKASIWT